MVKSKNYSVNCFNAFGESVDAKEKDILQQCEENHFMWDYNLNRELRVLTVRWGMFRFLCKKLN